MTDMTAFERRLSGEIAGLMGPARPVDDLAVFEAVAGRSPRWGFTVFSALKFVVASVIVALFGAFLLAGLLTTPQRDQVIPAAVTESPSPTTTEELLSGMVTEEVEPGIYRVIDDGAGHAPGVIEGDHVMPRSLDRLHIEPDGSVWVMTTVYGDDWGKPDDKAVAWQVGVEGRYGQEDRFPGHEYPNRMPSDLTFATAPDGTLWAAGRWGLGSFDGEAWTPHGEGIWANTVSVLPDGTAWAAWPDRIGRLGPDGWEWFDGSDGVPREIYQFAASPDGRVLAVGSGRLVGFDGVAWQDVRPLGSDVDTKVIGLRVAADGMLWAHLSDVDWSHDRAEPWLVRGLATDRSRAQQHYLARFDGDAWAVYSPTDGVPGVSGPNNTPNWEVHADGSVWVLADAETAGSPGAVRSLWSFDGIEWTERSAAVEQFTIGPDGSVWAITPEGVASFDGEAWTRYDLPVGGGALDVAPDGTAWALSNEDEHGLFVITREAMAGGQ